MVAKFIRQNFIFDIDGISVDQYFQIITKHTHTQTKFFFFSMCETEMCVSLLGDPCKMKTMCSKNQFRTLIGCNYIVSEICPLKSAD